jgi:hypothetical protein
MADIKSLEQLLAELTTFLRAYNRRLDTGDNSLAKDLLLLPYSVGGKAIMDQVEIARDLGILSRLEDVDLDNEATNYRLERNPGSFATVSLLFTTVNAPTANVVIPAGTQAQTSGTSFTAPVSFSTISETTFNLSNIETYFSFDRGRYEFPVTALADSIGVVGNVGANLVNILIGTVSEITGVTNLTASTGGLDEEVDDDFRARIQLAKTGRDLNIANGIRQFLKNQGFTDAQAVRVEDTFSEKATGIDVFVINQSSSSATETFTYDPAQTNYIFTNRPVLEVTSVTAGGSTLSSSDYSVNIDSTSPVRRSVFSNDNIAIRLSASLTVGQSFSVTYNYASLVRSAQDVLNLVENNILTADPLVKRGYSLLLNVTASLTLTTNADPAATRSRVRNALSQFAATYRLGDDLQKSDLIVVMQNGFGDFPVNTVDAVRISNYFLQDEDGNSLLPVDEVISVNTKQYIIFGTATIT